MKEKFIQIITTCGTKADGDRIARQLVEKKLAACVQILGPIESTYHWQGNIETAQEWLCLIKTKQSFYREIEQAILQVHPYEVPEILALPITAGYGEYLNWLAAALDSG